MPLFTLSSWSNNKHIFIMKCDKYIIWQTWSANFNILPLVNPNTTTHRMDCFHFPLTSPVAKYLHFWYWLYYLRVYLIFINNSCFQMWGEVLYSIILYLHFSVGELIEDYGFGGTYRFPFVPCIYLFMHIYVWWPETFCTTMDNNVFLHIYVYIYNVYTRVTLQWISV